jgi:hypothetical protein
MVDLYKGKINHYAYHPKYINVFVKGSLLSTLKMDIAKYTPPFLDYEDSKNYLFRSFGTKIIDERMVYVIKFRPRYDLKQLAFEGCLYILC